MGFYTKDNPVERNSSKEYSYCDVWKELVLDKTYTAKDRVIVCDSDMIAYRVASACDNRSILVSLYLNANLHCQIQSDYDTTHKNIHRL